MSTLGDLEPLIGWWADATDATAETMLPAVPGDNLHVRSGTSPDATISAAAVTCHLTGTEPPEVTELQPDWRGTLDFQAWMQTCARIRDERHALLEAPGETEGLLEFLPDELEEAVVALREAPAGAVVVDGPKFAVATLLLYQLDPDAALRVRPLQAGIHPLEAVIWERLELTPLLPVHTRLVDGELTTSAVELLNTCIRTTQTPLHD